MALENRINKIKNYFVQLNASEGVAYIQCKFPDKSWIVPKISELSGEYDVQMQSTDEGIYLFTEITNGFEVLFDVVDEIVSINEELIAKSAILKNLTQQLKEIVLNESLERLQTLIFVFSEKNDKKITTQENELVTEMHNAFKNAKRTEKKERKQAKVAQAATVEDNNNVVETVSESVNEHKNETPVDVLEQAEELLG